MRKILVVLMVLSGLVLFAGCDDEDNPTSTGGTTDSGLVGGTWQGDEEVCPDGTESNDEEFATFLADGTGTGTKHGIPFTFTWSVSGNRLTMTVTLLNETETGSGTFSVVDDRLIMNNDSEDPHCTYTFNRI